MDGLLIKSVEGRILLGIIMFVAIMILIGWITINEPARMAAFERQHTGRSIERGAEIFASSCSSCHGVNGLGGPQAPALNSPHLFGFDYLSGVNSEIAALQRQIAELQDLRSSLETEQEDLIAEAGTADEARRAEIDARLGEIDAQLNAQGEESIEAQIASFETQLEPLLAERDEAIANEQFQQAIDNGYLPSLDEKREEAEMRNDPLIFTNYLAEDASRLSQVAWGGDVRNYIQTTLIHGRPGSNDVWPGPMVAWSQRAGGPLRDDQINDLVAYILNWDKGDNWTLEDLARVSQYAKLHADANLISADAEATSSEMPDSSDGPPQIVNEVMALTGDASRGQELYTSEGCSGCHLNGAVGPITAGTWTRVQEERLTEPQFEDYTVEWYLIESIVNPNAYLSPGYQPVMPQNFGDLPAQDLADILAYLESQG